MPKKKKKAKSKKKVKVRKKTAVKGSECKNQKAQRTSRDFRAYLSKLLKAFCHLMMRISIFVIN